MKANGDAKQDKRVRGAKLVSKKGGVEATISQRTPNR
jgi:hypothetical protein